MKIAAAVKRSAGLDRQDAEDFVAVSTAGVRAFETAASERGAVAKGTGAGAAWSSGDNKHRTRSAKAGGVSPEGSRVH
jgi:hypothetical protein